MIPYAYTRQVPEGGKVGIVNKNPIIGPDIKPKMAFSFDKDATKFCIEPTDVTLVQGQTGCTYEECIHALKKYSGDIVNSIMYLTNSDFKQSTKKQKPDDQKNENTKKINYFGYIYDHDTIGPDTKCELSQNDYEHKFSPVCFLNYNDLYPTSISCHNIEYDVPFTEMHLLDMCDYVDHTASIESDDSTESSDSGDNIVYDIDDIEFYDTIYI